MSTENLKTVSKAQLLELNLSPTNYIIKGLIPQGFHILAGQPKFGKSWLLLHLCLQVSKVTVLYLYFEDSYNRIETRFSELSEDSYFYAGNNHEQQRDKRKTPQRTKSSRSFHKRSIFIIFRSTVLLHLCQHT